MQVVALGWGGVLRLLALHQCPCGVHRTRPAYLDDHSPRRHLPHAVPCPAPAPVARPPLGLVHHHCWSVLLCLRCPVWGQVVQQLYVTRWAVALTTPLPFEVVFAELRWIHLG